MLLLLYMSTEPYTRKEDSLQQKEKALKTKPKILKLLEVVWEPKEVAVVHCKGHQKGGDPVAKGNCHIDAATKEASWGQLPDKPKVLLALKIRIAPRYSPEEEKWIKKERGTKAKTEWCARCSVAQSCLTLCDPMDCSTPGLPVPHHLPEFAQVHVHCVDGA